MNSHQKKYALNRIEALSGIKLREAENKFTSKAVTITDEEKYKLIASGKVKIKPFLIIHRGYGSPDLYPSYDFSGLESESKLDSAKFEPFRIKVNKIAQDAKDQIMLGDCEEALKLIAKLEAITI